jgi:hypothetical protein
MNTPSIAGKPWTAPQISLVSDSASAEGGWHFNKNETWKNGQGADGPVGPVGPPDSP